MGEVIALKSNDMAMIDFDRFEYREKGLVGRSYLSLPRGADSPLYSRQVAIRSSHMENAGSLANPERFLDIMPRGNPKLQKECCHELGAEPPRRVQC